jgi:thiol:disulfide interchange protein
MVCKKWIPALLIASLIFLTACGVKTRKATIPWQHDVKAARALSLKTRKPILMDFTAEWCPWCKMLEDSTFSNGRVIEKMAAFVPLRIDVDKQKAVADQYGSNAQKYGGVGIPNILFLAPNGERLKHMIGYRNAPAFMATLDSVFSPPKK